MQYWEDVESLGSNASYKMRSYSADVEADLGSDASEKKRSFWKDVDACGLGSDASE